MGTRINYELYVDERSSPHLTLFSNGSHGVQIPEQLFMAALKGADGVTALTEALLSLRYETAGGTHSAGDRVFWIDTYPSDREFVIQARARYDDGKPIRWIVDKRAVGAPRKRFARMVLKRDPYSFSGTFVT